MHTAVCAALLLASGAETAMAEEAALHPVLGKTPPRELLNKDILALPERERAAWIHGAMSQMVQVYARVDMDIAQCLSAWAFDRGDGLEAVSNYIGAFPDQLGSVTILAVSRKACPQI